jgi:hypothetical protein
LQGSFLIFQPSLNLALSLIPSFWEELTEALFSGNLWLLFLTLKATLKTMELSLFLKPKKSSLMDGTLKSKLIGNF